jgi:hypothetical protein
MAAGVVPAREIMGCQAAQRNTTGPVLLTRYTILNEIATYSLYIIDTPIQIVSFEKPSTLRSSSFALGTVSTYRYGMGTTELTATCKLGGVRGGSSNQGDGISFPHSYPLLFKMRTSRVSQETSKIINATSTTHDAVLESLSPNSDTAIPYLRTRFPKLLKTLKMPFPQSANESANQHCVCQPRYLLIRP